MCLAVAGKVVSIDAGEGEVLIDGRKRRVSFIALPEAAPGDHVLVSLGLALERISEAEALQICAAWDKVSQIGLAREVTPATPVTPLTPAAEEGHDEHV